MTNPPSLQPPHPPPLPWTGYHSESHKRKYTITVGILGAVFFLAQVVIPFGVMMAVMPLMMFSRSDMFNEAHVTEGAFWDGAFWYVETRSGPSDHEGKILKRLGMTAEDSSLTDVDTFEAIVPRFLAAPERLWAVSSLEAGYYDPDAEALVLKKAQLGDISPPFFLDGRPAVIENSPSGCGVFVYESGGWRRARALPWLSPREELVIRRDLQACGFGRAFLRNILKLVDGFFSFMIGIMVAALSENWQRVGDMAARTVVVDIRQRGDRGGMQE